MDSWAEFVLEFVAQIVLDHIVVFVERAVEYHSLGQQLVAEDFVELAETRR